MEPNQHWDIFLVRLLHYQVPTLLRLGIKYRKKGTLRPAKKRCSSLMWNLTWSVSRAWMNLSGSIPIGNCNHSNRWVLWTTHAITSFYPYKRLTRYTNNLFRSIPLLVYACFSISPPQSSTLPPWVIGIKIKRPYSCNPCELAVILHTIRCTLQTQNACTCTHKMPGIVVCVETAQQLIATAQWTYASIISWSKSKWSLNMVNPEQVVLNGCLQSIWVSLYWIG
jgi:hypothetical protein